jgi:hypothetical protein
VTPGVATVVYVYGVARAGSIEPALAFRAVDGAGLAAVVGDFPAGRRKANRADLEAHDRVLEQLSGRGTVVPMRFGTVMASDADVRERLLEPHAAELHALLDRLDGRVQLSVTACYRNGNAERRAVDARMLAEPLAQVADDLRVEPEAGAGQAATIHILVESTRRAPLDAVVERLTAEHGTELSLRYDGPLPPYAFSDVPLDGDTLLTTPLELARSRASCAGWTAR